MQEIVKVCVLHGELTAIDCKKEKYKENFRYKCLICIADKRALNAINKVKKVCKKHGELTPDLVKKSGHCRLCHRESAGRARKLDRTRANEWTRNDRKNFPEKYRQWQKVAPSRQYDKRLEHYLRQVYKLSIEEYKSMIEKQDNKCKICGNEEKRKSVSEKVAPRLCIDHCHKTGVIRGLLCHECNKGLGAFKDSIDLLFRAVEYLDYFEQD